MSCNIWQICKTEHEITTHCSSLSLPLSLPLSLCVRIGHLRILIKITLHILVRQRAREVQQGACFIFYVFFTSDLLGMGMYILETKL